MKIYNFGSLNIDYTYHVEHISCEGETISSIQRTISPGGKGLNQTVALARAGADVVHVGHIGQEDGKFLLDFLNSVGICTSNISSVEGASGHAIIQVDNNGQNSIILFAGANSTITKADVDSVLSGAKAGDWLLLQNEITEVGYIIEKGHALGLKVFFNAAPFSKEVLSFSLDKLECLIVNEIEAMGIAEVDESTCIEAVIDRLEKKYPNVDILVTIGEKGSILISNGSRIHQDAFIVDVVDTTGAGDTFVGYYLSTISKGKTAEEALRIASKASSVMISRQGAAPTIPYISEITI